MGSKRLSILFKSSLDNLTSINSSFDKGVLRVAYHGANKNGSYISRETFEECINSIYNCPIVCNYSRETDSLGEHDVEIVKDDDGIKLVNVTQPLGVIPESAEWWWEEYEEDDGETHEYLCVDALIWKRQEAYKKIKDNGITDESMEINTKAGRREKKDGLFHITSFEFTAFCLIESAKPCFESAGLDMFALDDFRSQYVDMMVDFKKEFCDITSAYAADIDKTNEDNLKGGTRKLSKDELLLKYGLSDADIDFDIDGLSENEIEEKFAAIKTKKEEIGAPSDDSGKDAANFTDGDTTNGDTTPVVDDASDEDKSVKNKPKTFSLTGEQYRCGLTDELRKVKYINTKYPEWGEITRYYYCDYDPELHEVYAYDDLNWKLYGFKYVLNGDNFVIDFGCAKRKKCSFVDFDEGDPSLTTEDMFNGLAQCFDERFSAMHNEIETLRKYRQEKIDEERGELEKETFSQFTDLDGVDAFESLKKDCSKYSIDEIEEKCFAIRGRTSVAKFSAEARKSTRIPVEKTNNKSDEPYGGLFVEYGVSR